MSNLRSLASAVRATNHTPDTPASETNRPRVASAVLRASLPRAGTGADLPEGYLADIIDAMDISAEDRRPDTDYTHVSSTLHGCPRALALFEKFGGSAVTDVQRGMRIIWALGRAAEHHTRTQLIKAIPDEVYGGWSCACGQTELSGTRTETAEETCPVCNQHLLKYEEFTLFNEELKIVGNPDLLLLRNGLFIPVEFKSMNVKAFGELTSEEAAHALQVLMYRRMAKDLGMNVSDYSLIIYINKDFLWGKNPYREFRVSEQGSAYSAGLDIMEQNARELDRYRRTRRGMPQRLPVCTDPTTPRAKGCDQCCVCFST